MKTIHVVRHSKAVGHDLGISDFERKLEKKGSKDAKQVAARLKKRSGRPQLIVTSPAARALGTARQFARELGIKKKNIVQEPELYEADAKKILELVNNLPDDNDSVLIVGHNPAFEAFAHDLTRGFHAALPTSAVVTVEIAVDSWKSVKSATGTLTGFDHPARKKELSEEAKVIRKKLQEELTESISNLLKKMNSDAVLRIEAQVAKSADNIARKFVKEFTTRGLSLLPATKAQKPAASPKAAKTPAKPAAKRGRPAASSPAISKGQSTTRRKIKKITATPKKEGNA
jgi:phosphohistidine phosphatase